MYKLLVLIFCLAALTSGAANANQILAMQSGCLGCHQVDAKLVGPAFKDVAAKYAADPSQIERLVNKIKTGSSAGEPLLWGSVAMPPNQAEPEAIRQIIEWLMTLK